jgi:diguanylate cyclase (GGDEF)-like protein
MTLDVNTLFLVTIYVEAMLGLLLLFAWVQNTAIHAVAWWGSAHLLRAASITLFGMYGQWPPILTIDLSNAVLLTSFAATWTGARVFDGRPLEPVGLMAGAALWLFVSRLSGFNEWPEFRTLVSNGIIASYTWLAAAEFWRNREEQLVSRLPAVFVLFAHGALFLLRTPLVALPWSQGNDSVTASVWITVLSSEALLFTISIAFILLAMAKERMALDHKNAAMVDALTGISNRRGFLSASEELARRQKDDPQLAAVLLIDFDKFKLVNDRFGHAVGDRVLQIFADVAVNAVRPSDVVGRLGGEEFAAILYNVGRERAVVIAERLRASFAEAGAIVDGHPVGATLSIGLAYTEDRVFDVPELLVQADQALYRAKERGRNRLEIVPDRTVAAKTTTPPPLAQTAA